MRLVINSIKDREWKRLFTSFAEVLLGWSRYYSNETVGKWKEICSVGSSILAGYGYRNFTKNHVRLQGISMIKSYLIVHWEMGSQIVETNAFPLAKRMPVHGLMSLWVNHIFTVICIHPKTIMNTVCLQKYYHASMNEVRSSSQKHTTYIQIIVGNTSHLMRSPLLLSGNFVCTEKCLLNIRRQYLI